MTNHEGTILRLLRKHGSMSRAELARKSGLSGAALSKMASKMLAAGYVKEGNLKQGGIGRPSVMLSIQNGAAYVAGIHISANQVQIVLMDVLGKVVTLRECDYDNSREDIDEIVAGAAKRTNEMILRSGIDRRKFIAVGISLPGIIDSELRRMKIFKRGEWLEADFASQVERHLGVPAIISHNVSAMAMAENLYGSGASGQNKTFLFVYMRAGIGAGYIVDGKLFRPHDGSSIELGHVFASGNGERCRCGAVGCLEAVCSEEAVRIRLGLGDSHKGNLISAIMADKPFSKEFVENMSVALASTINLLNPQLITFGGHFADAPESFFSNLREATVTKILEPRRIELRFSRSLIKRGIGPVGAGAVALEQLFFSGEMI